LKTIFLPRCLCYRPAQAKNTCRAAELSRTNRATRRFLTQQDNKPGSLARICERLADARINIEYCYCATPPNARRGLLVLRVNNPKKAMKVLNS
jgi:hypothetical protein